jgi:hypothetical protein
MSRVTRSISPCVRANISTASTPSRANIFDIQTSKDFLHKGPKRLFVFGHQDSFGPSPSLIESLRNTSLLISPAGEKSAGCYPRNAFDLDEAIVLLDDSVNDRQSEPRSLARFFVEEGLECASLAASMPVPFRDFDSNVAARLRRWIPRHKSRQCDLACLDLGSAVGIAWRAFTARFVDR